MTASDELKEFVKDIDTLQCEKEKINAQIDKYTPEISLKLL